MKTWVRWTLHVCTALVGGSGIAYFWMKYLLTTDDPFALVNHPLQPLMLAVHIVASPALVLAFGMAFESHISAKLRARHIRANRRSGWIAVLTFATMSMTGYALQVTTNQSVGRGVLVVHLSSGALFLVSYSVHVVVGLKRSWAARDSGPRSEMVA
jgi:hypothetical protein